MKSIMKSKEDLIRDQRGVTLLIVLVMSVLLVVLGLSMTVSSMTEFSMSHELQNKKIASLTASGGFASVINSLEGETLDNLLSDATDVPKYFNYSVPTPSSDAEIYFNRNPIAPIEAMNIDFDNPPTQIGTRSVAGLLTSASGETLPSGGRYWAKLTDNDDGDSDFTTDQDGKVYLRVLAVSKIGAGQISTFGGTVKNTVSILEAALKLDGTFSVDAPLSFVAPRCPIHPRIPHR